MNPSKRPQSLESLWRILALLMLLAGTLLGTAHAQVVTYFHNDIAGTPMAATDAGGNLLWKETYRPYGERLLNPAHSNTNPLWFGGKSQDPTTGLSYLGARYYNPQLGRFMGIDPKEVDPEDLHSFNRYAYANNNPYKYVDPNGRYAVPLIVLAARAISQRVVTFALTRGAQTAITAGEIASGDALGGASLAAGAAAGVKKGLEATTKTSLAHLQGTFDELAEQHLLPQFRNLDSSLKAGYTGSFKTGIVGNPNKTTYGQPIDLNKFDINYWIESDILFQKNGPKLKANPEFRKVLSETPGFEGLKPNKEGFSIKFKKSSED